MDFTDGAKTRRDRKLRQSPSQLLMEVTPDASNGSVVGLKSEIGSSRNWKELNEMVIKEGDFREGAAFFLYRPLLPSQRWNE